MIISLQVVKYKLARVIRNLLYDLKNEQFESSRSPRNHTRDSRKSQQTIYGTATTKYPSFF